MKPFAFPLISACCALVLASLDAGAETVARAYGIQNITELEVGSASKLVLVQGNSDTLRVEGEPEVIQRVKVDQEGQRLTLSMKDHANGGSGFLSLFKRNTPTFYLQLKNLDSLKLHGASEAHVGRWTGKSLAVHLHGASDLEFTQLALENLQMEIGGASNLTMKDLSAGISSFRIGGASDAKVAGQSRFLKVDAGGASNYYGKSLKANQAELKASGASDIDAHVTEQLKAEASGASDINYLGDPKTQINSSGASDIKAI
jgi:hypothetical protein